tara:strand:- start:28 stop:492 length:465 start_codon:yes stop_codon:yes gene_type:complete
MIIKEKLGREYVLLKEQNKKKLLSETHKNKKKGLLVVFEPATEEILRFALEKTAVDMVVNVENIHPKDHTHYVRSGLDQVLGKIAAAKGKLIMFDFNNLVKSNNLSKIMARMRLNIKLCKKYKVKMLLTDLATERTVADLTSFLRVVEKEKNLQ